MSRSQQDQFIDDDEDETCPLCVEEFDLQDKGFRPCPCGYQICQFCYNNVKNNMNGLCPACRRPYDDENIEYKVITPDEQAAHKARQTQRQKKTQAALQKEKQKAEADHLSRKHLAGLRVVQKNLVYVTGLQPSTHEDQLLQTLRGHEYFGQYGKIIKIVVSKAKDPSHPHSVGVYVTFERREDAANCIAAVDGTKNHDRTLRAQFGTTKYCSAYLRGENCTNRNCMFLHEPGEANESYSRADLSALNAGHGRAPPPQTQQPVASASQPMGRQSSQDQQQSPPDRPALPSTASWASRPTQQQPSRAESRSTSTTFDSPAPENVLPIEPESEESPTQEQSAPQESFASEATVRPFTANQRPRKPRQVSPLITLIKNLKLDDLKFYFSITSIPNADVEVIKNYPPLFDQHGGTKRKLRRQREEEQRRMEQEAQAFQQPPPIDQDENLELSGSLQLGGEPEERQSLSQPQSAIQPPGQEGLLDQRFQFGGITSPEIGDRGLASQQHPQHLQTGKPPAQGSYLNNANLPTSLHNPPGHQRNTSRYSFANDSSATTSIKPVANQKLLNQQSAMMPPTSGAHFGPLHQSHGSTQFYTSNVQGPPPGLKTTGTPPVSGGMTFGQGHGFATGGLQYGAANTNPARSANEEMMRNLLRGGRDAGADAAKQHDADFPPLAIPPNRQHNISVALDEARKLTSPVPPGVEAAAARAVEPAHTALAEQALADASEPRRSTPTVPPGLTKPLVTVPDSEGSRPSSRASLARTTSQITPVVPLRPATPAGTTIPIRQKPVAQDEGGRQIATQDERGDVATPHLPTLGSSSTKDIATENASPKAMPYSQWTKAFAEASGAREGRQSIPEGRVKAEKSRNLPPKQPFLESSNTADVVGDHDSGKAMSHDQSNQRGDKASEAAMGKRKAPASRQTSAPHAIQPASKGQATVQASDAEAAPVIPQKPEAANAEEPKRKHPGKLDTTLSVAEEQAASSSEAPAQTNTRIKAQPDVSQALPSMSNPNSPRVASPVMKSAPRNLRVVPLPKTETPILGSLTTSLETTPSQTKFPSRQPSIASIQLPGTPSSEQASISDNISVTSTSQSRANSPPPSAGKVASTASRVKTKSQLKKERQDRAKAIEEERKDEEPTKTVEEEPAQEAIISRKKKTKKEKEKEPKSRAEIAAPAEAEDSAPTSSRTATPPPKSITETPPNVEQPVRDPELTNLSMDAPTAPTPPLQSPHELSPPPTPTLTAAQVLAELKATAPDIQRCIDSLFRSSASNHYKPNQSITAKDLSNPARWKQDYKLNLTKEEVDALLKGKAPAFRYGGEDGRMWDRGMITPTGAHLRALTEELEVRFLELEKAIRSLPEELRYRPTKPQNEMKFPSIDLEALKRDFDNAGGRGVSVMERMVQDGAAIKKGAFLVDEASKYINEFVMPPATPPPGDGGGAAGSPGTGAQLASGEFTVPSPAVAERQLIEARRIADERDAAVKKAMKKNKKLLGLG